MMYSDVLLKTDMPLGELAELLGPLLGLEFGRGGGWEYSAGRHRRTFGLSSTEWAKSCGLEEFASYPAHILISGNAERARMRNAREIFEAVKALGIPVALADEHIIIDRWEPETAPLLKTKGIRLSSLAPNANLPTSLEVSAT